MAYVDSAAVLLVPRLPITCVREIIGFAGYHRCDMCGEKRSVALKDGHGRWVWWCMDCALGLLLDVTHNNINVMEHSVSVSRLTDLRISDVASVECTE